MTRSDPPRPRGRKRAEQVAFGIVQKIVARGQQAGDKLPHEAEMLAEYGVSRSSLREALRLLEVQGLVTIRPGRRGSGTEVGRIDPANLAGTLVLYLMMQRVNMNQLLEAWGMVRTLAGRSGRPQPRPRPGAGADAPVCQRGCPR